MYNKFLERFLDNDPKKIVTKNGMKIRKMINPFVKKILKLGMPTKLKVLHRAKLPEDKPIIFVATHGFREDIEAAIITADRPVYLLLGALGQTFYNIAGIFAWINGVILVDRQDKESRIASKEKMKRALKMGGSILMYPEGTWNVSPNKMMAGLYPGVYDVAKETGALVAPIGTHRVSGAMVYSILGKAFDITKYDRKKGMEVLTDKMATLRWRLMEHGPVQKRADLPKGGKALDLYWKKRLESLYKEVDFWEYELEKKSIFLHKDIPIREEIFAFMKNLDPSHATAFLHNKRNIGHYYHLGHHVE